MSERSDALWSAASALVREAETELKEAGYKGEFRSQAGAEAMRKLRQGILVERIAQEEAAK